MKIISALLILLITGCTTATEIRSPNGQKGFAIECKNMTSCYAKAGEVCPSGYNLVDNDTRTTGASVAFNNAIIQSRSTVVVECK